MGSKYVLASLIGGHFVQSADVVLHHKQFQLQGEHKGLSGSLSRSSKNLSGHSSTHVKASLSRYTAGSTPAAHFVHYVEKVPHHKQAALHMVH